MSQQSTSSLSVALQRANEDYAMVQQEWEREEKEQLKRCWSIEDEMDTLVKYNTDLQQEVKTLQAKCSASQVFSRMRILLETLSREERKEDPHYFSENDDINSVQNTGGVHRALRIALLAGCHCPTGKTLRNRQSDIHPFSHVRTREADNKNETFVQPLLQQQQLQREEQQKACEYYLQLCEDLEERACLQAEEKRLSESCRILETAKLEARRRIKLERQTVRQLGAIATELEVLK
ncbi:hypothetical protein LSM04_008881 [Trypanosoma melophagium]|uniref:uncharacterized protein n=1 Tax=Trypanosoma melophagium TaxID=715481 RepID=UPI00351A8594|nr:hypothetical protein LSM04_008881 [Trypanosoma melophagium]